MTKTKQYDGLPFFIGSGTKIQKENIPNVQSAIYQRFRTIDVWMERYKKGREIEQAIKDKEQGVVKNVNLMYAYNAYQKFLQQSLLSLRDVFRLYSENFRVDVNRPTTIMKSYLDAITQQNDLLIDDAILYGCASILLDVDVDDDGNPMILCNRIRSEKIIYDYEQPGVALFNIRITPEVAHKLDFLPDNYRQELFNRAVANAERVTKLNVFVGELVVDGKLDNYIALIYQRHVIYAEKNRALTSVRSVSLYDKNNDCSPIYTVLRASELSQDSIKMMFDYNDEIVNPIRSSNWKIDANAWEEAKRTRFLKLPTQAVGQIQTLLPGNLDVSSLLGVQDLYSNLAQQAAGLNEYTMGEASGSVRTYGEAMMLADSASGIMNILANKIKQKLILPILQDILEVLKITMAPPKSDIFPDDLQVDLDIVKDQQESNMLVSLINMPMFGAVIQGLNGIEALQLFRWILNKLHISGTESIFSTVIGNNINNRPTIGTQMQTQQVPQQQQQRQQR